MLDIDYNTVVGYPIADQQMEYTEVPTVGRPWRVEYPGAIHHVTAHAIAGQDLFPVDGDRDKFLSLLTDVHRRWGTVFHGYCLMGNHYHLEVETPDGALSEPMKSLNYRYASYLNWRLQRRGHVFDGRFKSISVDADIYLHELSRYIHLNPVRAQIVSHPADYRWSSYRAYIGLATPPPWLVTELTLARFGDTEQRQHHAYRKFVEAGSDGLADALGSITAGSIPDSERALAATELGPDCVACHGSRRHQPERALLIGLDSVAAVVSAELGVDAKALRTRGKRLNHARDVAVYLAARRCGQPLAEVGSYFGGVSGEAISHACRRVEEMLRRDSALSGLVERMAKQLVSGTES